MRRLFACSGTHVGVGIVGSCNGRCVLTLRRVPPPPPQDRRGVRQCAALALLRALIDEGSGGNHYAALCRQWAPTLSALGTLLHCERRPRVVPGALACVEAHARGQRTALPPLLCATALQATAAAMVAYVATTGVAMATTPGVSSAAGGTAGALAVLERQFGVLNVLAKRHSTSLRACVGAFAACLRAMLSAVCPLAATVHSAGGQAGSADRLIVQLTDHLADHTHSAADGDGDATKDAVLTLCRSVARLLQQFATFAGASKHAPFLIMDYLALQQRFVLPRTTRAAITPGVHALLGTCKEHEIALIGTVVDEGAKTQFQELHHEFQSYFKYTGKV